MLLSKAGNMMHSVTGVKDRPHEKNGLRPLGIGLLHKKLVPELPGTVHAQLAQQILQPLHGRPHVAPTWLCLCTVGPQGTTSPRCAAYKLSTGMPTILCGEWMGSDHWRQKQAGRHDNRWQESQIQTPILLLTCALALHNPNLVFP